MRYVIARAAAPVAAALLLAAGAAPAVAASAGDLDTSFANPALNGDVQSLAVQPDGKIIVGGSFTTVAGQPRSRVARLNADGSLDTTFFNPNVNGTVKSVAITSTGRILVGGSFTQAGGSSRTGIARLTSSGALDATFTAPKITQTSAQVPLAINAVVLQASGKILVGGNFDKVSGQARGALARLASGGALDTTFADPAITSTVADVHASLTGIAAQPDGKVLVVGGFDSVRGQPRRDFARLSSDGTLDAGFAFPGLTGEPPLGVAFPSSLALQGDGKILLGGTFAGIAGQARRNLARLNTDGILDAGFANPAIAVEAGGFFAPDVRAIAVQADGNVLAGGRFALVGGQARASLARLLGTSSQPGSGPGSGSGQPGSGSGSTPGATISVGSLALKSSAGAARLASSARVSGAGKVTQSLTSGSKKPRTWCRTSASASGAGPLPLVCAFSARSWKTLRKGNLKLTLRTVFTAASGAAVTDSRAVTIKRRR